MIRMSTRSLSGLVVIGILASLMAATIGGTSAYFSDSGSVEVQVSAASVTTVSPSLPKKVWVCKMVGTPDNPRLAPGKNPIHVSVNSVDAHNGFSDAHPSYIVDEGAECVVPDGATEPVPPETTVPADTPVPVDTTFQADTTVPADTTAAPDSTVPAGATVPPDNP